MEKRTKERDARRSSEMGKKKKNKREEGVCVSTPSSSWRHVQDFPQNGKQHFVSARKLAAHLYMETFPTCNQVPIHIHASTYQTGSVNGGLMSELAVPSSQLHQTFRGRYDFQQSTTSGTDISSSEVASYSPSDSIKLPSTRIQATESTLGLGKSAEMVKVVNRMGNLEKRHISSGSHLNACNGVRHDSQKRIRDLCRYDLNEQHKVEVEVLVEKILEGRARKSLSTTILALKTELDDERRHRKQLESLNRKLAQKIVKIKLSFSSNIKEVENEIRSRKMVEALCDKFAKALLDKQSEASYAHQHRLKEDKQILNIAEAWLYERPRSNQHSNSKEIENFLKAKHSFGLKTTGDLSFDPEDVPFYRRSSESFLLNESGNQIPAHEENSTENELSCFEHHKRTTSRKSTGSFIGTADYCAIDSNLMVKNLNRKYSSTSEHKRQASDIREISADSSSQMKQLRSKLTPTTSPANQKHHSLAWKSKEGSLGSHLLEARKRRQYCTPSSGGSKSQNVFR